MASFLGLTCHKPTEPLQEGLSKNSPAIPGTHVIDLRRMKSAKSILEPPIGFEPGITGLGMQCLNYYVIAS